MAHDYHGFKASRAMRKQSKLGPGIIDAARLEWLLLTDGRRRRYCECPCLDGIHESWCPAARGSGPGSGN